MDIAVQWEKWHNAWTFSKDWSSEHVEELSEMSSLFSELHYQGWSENDP